MTRYTLSKEGLPDFAQQTLRTLGENIRTARKRRRWSLDEMAGSMLVTRKTLARLEAGDPAVSLAVLAGALHALNMMDDISSIASPEKDSIGIFNEKQHLPKKVRKEKRKTDRLDF